MKEKNCMRLEKGKIDVKSTFEEGIKTEKKVAIYCAKSGEEYFFDVSSNTLSIFKNRKLKESLVLFENVEADVYMLTEYGANINIVAFKDNTPIYWVSYNTILNQKVGSRLEIIADGFENETKICKQENGIIVVNGKGRIIFSSKGTMCYKKKLNRRGNWFSEKVYLVEKGKDEIELYCENGEKI